MMNIGQMMKQVQEMQAKMAQMQEHLASVEVEGQAGGGMVNARMNGKAELRKVTIDPKVIADGDKELLEDLIVAAVNDAKGKVEKAVAEETSKMMGGLKLPPGMTLPF
ncbi:MAG: YbaB/EbfC family nucleoid-associated protein [Alphaproteobacteria bacterium]|nr:YbaB/EbfC family nucleoid-associated protein [Alphaproteobacteria bacterium]